METQGGPPAPAPKKPWGVGKIVGVVGSATLAGFLLLGTSVFAMYSCVKNTLTNEPHHVIAPGDPLSGTNWRSSDGSLLKLSSDGTFIWYQSESDVTDMYYLGTYEVLFGERAIEHVTVDLAEYGITRTELEAVFARSPHEMNVESFCTLTLNNEQKVVSGENILSSPYSTPCYGFYYSESAFLDIANMNSGSSWGFTKAH